MACSKKITHVFILLILGGLHQSSFALPKSKPKQEEADSKFDRAVVVADFIECSKIGRDMLKEGGNAVDAAIAAMLCVGIYNCHSAGIGGGHTAVVYNRVTQKTRVVNAREKAPRRANANMFTNVKQILTNGTKFIATPGEVMGFWNLHTHPDTRGRLPWKRLFEPAIDLARNGFKVHAALAKALKNEKTHIRNDPGLSSVFLKGSKLVTKGDWIKMTKLADTLQTIADDGSNAFYTGSIATKIAQELRKGTGYDIDQTDLKEYRAPISTNPLIVDYSTSNLQMYTARPPANGAITAFMLNVMDEYGLINSDILKNQTKKNLFYHRFVETSKFACANMHGLGDEDMDPDNTIKNEITRLVDKTTARNVKDKIQDNTTHKKTSFYSEHGMGVCSMMDSKGVSSTSHVSVIDEDGSAVSMTSSINRHFGAKFLGPQTGIIYNNHMADFIYDSSDRKLTNEEKKSKNLIAANKRPMSSISPLIFVDSRSKDVVLVTGGAGASTITPSTLQVAMNYQWLGKTVRDSVQKRRLYYNSTSANDNAADGYVIYEQDYDSNVIKYLERANHRTRKRINGAGDMKLGIIQLAAKDGTNVWGYSDKRKKGAKAAGYR